MKVLLDTHTFLWFIMGNERLSKDARACIEDLNNEKYISIVSLWEIAIKTSLGKMGLSGSFETVIPKQLEKNGFEVFGITFEHLVLVSSLPFYHRDPFDRLIIAQSLVDNMSIIGVDTIFDSYSVSRVW